MRYSKMFQLFLTAFFCLITIQATSQIQAGIYRASETLEDGRRNYLLFVSDEYMIHTVYNSNPAAFVVTLGGFYTLENDSLLVNLEFNSNFEQNGERMHRATYGYTNGKLIFNGNDARGYTREAPLKQDLDGEWLFATRGPDTGQDRRGDENPRKTLKFLLDGYFQWIAYRTDDMRFMGTGGGRYAATDGNYIESIRFFSRDSTRVGAELGFQYERKGNDWHHKGNNSRGEPMYEIWALRNPD